ncbi:hypothetical protein A2W54_01920 [Candidatus Giovannonibacteria bacterium RIFCSPHIGHO2_02_43_13]|uniref:Ribosome-binding factor A n=1 Tax=Candidatus Giovannonibacteria bacterium RIFCSPHIGHO2_02_43_13 TaxID=1798330 RepID=A0A1F5WU93_9BACT|nr:MAG: hypothetical protein UW28_C0012G0001 [Parcubacteria group bacterium GW2011_GWA2_44_13]OGF72111.1 MAG: hypothetical protein A3E06_00205 [Candidatus Giovannonibacteria bacterium RIFCSPHIGHO2_12_FULL_44_42]OGF79216.1 MAG: hypothetical protein A2W54_01920 [Candidatus Giovannonibacteria bacterium RIFCSPHIGHO2_02_43_13]OGF89986.1 MAG: hypothetical protein A3I94_04235 [Candidatus Giovannonibacteria bacterium RIFCSPLOWO2_02_FULL_43_54]OGF97105.1 MAG: hypothetical protein A3H08_02520 [Candidatus
MSHNTERLASFLEREVTGFLMRHAVLPEGSFFSVSRVILDNSLDKTQVFILIFPDKSANEAFKEIRRFEREARKYIASRLKRHKMPQIKFVLDTTQTKQVRLEKLLENIEND